MESKYKIGDKLILTEELSYKKYVIINAIIDVEHSLLYRLSYPNSDKLFIINAKFFDLLPYRLASKAEEILYF